MARAHETSRQADKSKIDILLDEVSPAMRIEGACVLRGWLEHDAEFKGVSLGALAGIVYSHMKTVQKVPGHHGTAGSSRRKTKRR